MATRWHEQVLMVIWVAFVAMTWIPTGTSQQVVNPDIANTTYKWTTPTSTTVPTRPSTSSASSTVVSSSRTTVVTRKQTTQPPGQSTKLTTRFVRTNPPTTGPSTKSPIYPNTLVFDFELDTKWVTAYGTNSAIAQQLKDDITTQINSLLSGYQDYIGSVVITLTKSAKGNVQVRLQTTHSLSLGPPDTQALRKALSGNSWSLNLPYRTNPSRGGPTGVDDLKLIDIPATKDPNVIGDGKGGSSSLNAKLSFTLLIAVVSTFVLFWNK